MSVAMAHASALRQKACASHFLPASSIALKSSLLLPGPIGAAAEAAADAGTGVVACAALMAVIRDRPDLHAQKVSDSEPRPLQNKNT